MVDVNATRLCVVCGVVFVRDKHRVCCSDDCKKAREAQVHRSSAIRHGRIKGEQSLTCKHCDAQFVGTSNKVYCTQRCKDRARPAPKQPRKKSRNDAQRARERELRKQKPRDRSNDNDKAKQKRREQAELRRLVYEQRKPELDAIKQAKAYESAHALAIRMDAARDVSIAKKAVKVAAKAEKKAKSDKAKAMGLPSAELEKLRSNLVKYAEYLTKSRAKTYKRKTGKVMPDDGTVDAVVMFGSPRCLYCDCRLSWANRTHDHMIPLTKRGVHSARNIAPACKDCNDKKGPKEFYVWVQSLDDEHKQRAIKFFEERNGTAFEFPERLAA